MHVMNVIVSTVYVDGLVQDGINSIATNWRNCSLALSHWRVYVSCVILGKSLC